jgi:hypothetical protein
MKKFLSKLLTPFLLLSLLAGGDFAFAQGPTGPEGEEWYYDGTGLLPIISNVSVGTDANPIASIIATDVTIKGTLILDGVAAGDIDMDGYDILNLDNVTPDSTDGVLTFLLGAGEKVVVDSSTTDSTQTDGEIDVNADAAADNVSGVDISLTSQGDYSNLAASRLRIQSGGMLNPGDFNVGKRINMGDHVNDAGNSIVAGTLTVSDVVAAGAVDWYEDLTLFKDVGIGVGNNILTTGNVVVDGAFVDAAGGANNVNAFNYEIGCSTIACNTLIGGVLKFRPNIAGIGNKGGLLLENVGSEIADWGLMVKGDVTTSLTTSNNDVVITPGGSNITVIGDAGSSSHGLTDNDDLLVTDDLEVIDDAYIDGTITDADGNEYLPAITASTTYYVDGDAGSDSNDCLSWGNACKTMDLLYSGSANAIPRQLDAAVTVNVRGTVLSSGTTYHTYIDYFEGDGSLTIEGTTTDVETGIAVTGQDNTASSITYHSYLDASGESWSADEHIGRYIVVTNGVGTGSTLYPIIANTATRLESVSLPNLDGTSVVKIVSLPELKGAQVSDPGTLVNYASANPFEVRSNEISMFINKLDLTNVTSTDTFRIRNIRESLKFTNISTDLQMQLLYTEQVQFNGSALQYDNFRYLEVAQGSIVVLSDTGIFSTDGFGLGVYSNQLSASTIQDSRFHDQNIAYAGDIGSVGTFAGTHLLMDECDYGLFSYQADVYLFAYSTSAYANFKNTTTAMSLGGARNTVGDDVTFQGSGVTTEVQVSDTAGDTAAFSDLNSQNTVQNTATGAVVTYMNHSTFVPIQNPEYDNTTSGLDANNFQDGLDEIVNEKMIIDPSSTQSLNDDGTINCNDFGYNRVTGNGAAVVLDTDPAITDGVADGQYCIIEGTSDANTVTIADTANVLFAGSVDCVLGQYDNVTLQWNAGASYWIARSECNNI